jgi:hypothetical protein
MNLKVTVTETAKDTVTLEADGVEFEFDTAIANKRWICNSVKVLPNSYEFESLLFFYADWLEDIFDSFPQIDQFTVRYMLFAYDIAAELSIDI